MSRLTLAALQNNYRSYKRLRKKRLGKRSDFAFPLDLDFIENEYLVNGQIYNSFLAIPGSSFARTSSATRFNEQGQLELVANDVPRFDHDPITLQPLGLLSESSTSNELLNCTLDGANLATQTVSITVSAGNFYMLSFYGTGTVTLSGSYNAVVVGNGSFPARTTYVLTGVLNPIVTFTVTGQVQFAQLEYAPFQAATSFIPTGAVKALRAADVTKLLGVGFAYNQTEGAWLYEYLFKKLSTGYGVMAVGNAADTTNRFQAIATNLTTQFSVRKNNITQATFSGGVPVIGSINKVAFAYKVNDLAYYLNGGSLQTDNVMEMPIGVDTLYIGSAQTGLSQFCGHTRRIGYAPVRISNDDLYKVTLT